MQRYRAECELQVLLFEAAKEVHAHPDYQGLVCEGEEGEVGEHDGG